MSEQSCVPAERGILIIGLGLIGGSLAAALKDAGYAGRILACDRDANEVARGIDMGLVDAGSTEMAPWVAESSLIVLAVPVLAMEAVLRELAPHLGDQVITDVGSTKGAIEASVERVFGSLPPRFVPGHPIAGSEKSGVAASNPTLYRRHKVILTPRADTDPDALARVRVLWAACGAELLELDVARHDQVLARTSHLPHLLAFSLVDTLARQDERLEIFRYAAGGFRDFTRIAGSDPVMWRDIFSANREAVLGALDEFEAGVARLRRAVTDNDGDAMLAVFDRASHARQYFDTLLNQTSYQAMEQRNIRYRVTPGGDVRGRIRVPGDKSISHRSIMLGALAEGVTEVHGFLEGEDSLATLQAFREMGVAIEGPHQGRVTIHGVGLHGLTAPAGPLYVGNSGTAMRLFAGLLAGQAFDTELTGDVSLNKRPMGRVADPLREMGAVIETAEGGRPPLTIRGGQALRGIRYDMPMASAQVKSCLLLAGLYAEGETRVREPAPTRDHTERMLNGFGYAVQRAGDEAWLQGGGRLTASPIDVPSDISSAAFYLVAAAITPGSDLLLEHVGTNPTRIGVINILKAMGADLELLNPREVGGEPVADIRVRHAPLKGIDIPVDQVPLAIDEFPVLFIAAANAEGVTRLRGAEELRVKESDRIQAMADGLTTLGVENTVHSDGIDIVGRADASDTHIAHYRGGHVDSLGDHRIAMAFAIAALRAEGEIVIDDCANVATSFPGFVDLARRVGLSLEEQEAS
ncbi:bifunctional prephenate dehydrogenase/3-phosphoshikimate 1-carboxyvinyltransferase [Chromohalobacter canadensis]|uniref:bifunctional prephenate dehydrogenase/3-phosphoshikimate 1-carboxyvinyltransferase n=1 Tax=Chromohalobacter canadensis TaxID=141389 RepID=UPI0021BEA1D7|nr:bifunctional prephenate dehydrogenase/3-phosphoshikimate 1-carboxyvinyltransferase [Chromohalobacter canadensis]MCT8469563.1 bifunctional prephenate dehydrogenase/3-phosphoshikimate 1-carboxyvinyltransferase [Chromohalobacter canadensis]MCT8472187.1 bifunctional prephenate dehydrogenase/3-phosphoshikimate 1-carboxyvinyltransferase [Chromohalobacter canadensis]MCT8499701.1 bifunctional prephenate dehydrogenase/3-phosphoshikimate 1-carboxyvinyltransferase [Chromohalobacter canadensis]